MNENDNLKKEDVMNANDAFDINELASLNDDISPEFIEQLQNQLVTNSQGFINTNDGALFEEVGKNVSEVSSDDVNKKPVFEDNIDDNFIKKYKARLNKQQNGGVEAASSSGSAKISGSDIEQSELNIDLGATPEATSDIEVLSSGNIIERPLVQSQVAYNDSLDFLDDNIKYSKYVIYIDPENTNFIESLTVKERKNLINKILREQDDILITKKRFSMMHLIMKHIIISIVTISISIPIIYGTINASLEATINNHRRSQTIFKTLYKEKGKIKKKSISY
jgi:hypothetical protein